MDYFRILAIAIFFGCLLELAFTSLPSYIPCFNSTYAPCRCTRRNLWKEDTDVLTCKDIPMDTVRRVLRNIGSSQKEKYLTIENSELTTLPKSFLGNISVKSLVLKLPNLVNVDEGAFIGQESALEWLEFNGCKLPSIPAKSISKLNALKTFAFKGSKVKLPQVTRDTFARLTNASGLDTLLLGNNGIRTVGKGTFKRFTKLRTLYLGENDLTELNSDSLPPQKLRTISLENNAFSDIPSDLYENVMEKGVINLNNNKLVKVSPAAIIKLLHKKIKVTIFSNALVCDCALKHLAEHLEEVPRANILPGSCAGPEKLKGKFIDFLKVSDFPHCY